MLTKPWIKVEDGVLINLNFIIKIVRHTTATPTEGILFLHGSSGTGASQFVGYADATAADAKFAEIQALLDSSSVFKDVSA